MILFRLCSVIVGLGPAAFHYFVLPSAVALLVASCPWSSALYAQGGPSPVHVATVVEIKTAEGRTFIGTVMPARKSTVGSAVAGRVEQMFVEEGDPLRMVSEGDPPQTLGQPLVQLRTRTIEIEWSAARAEAQLRQQELDELLAGSREEEKVQAEARRDGAQAVWKYAESRFQRTEALFRQSGTVTQEDLDEALSQKVAAEKDYIAAKAAYELVRKGPRREKIEQARARLEMAKETARRLEDLHSKYTIRAPFPGYVVAKHTEVGAWVSEGDPVAEVVELDPVEITAAIPSSYINQLRESMPVAIGLDASPQRISGTVYRIVPQADLKSRTFPVKIRLANPDRLLKPGMLARVTFPIGRQQSALMIPKDALVLDREQHQIVAVVPDAKTKQPVARRLPVQLGVEEENLIQVIDASGWIRAGQAVVVMGNERLRTGQPLRVLPSPKKKAN